MLGTPVLFGVAEQIGRKVGWRKDEKGWREQERVSPSSSRSPQVVENVNGR